jgi:large subunit ribosomal protein L5
MDMQTVYKSKVIPALKKEFGYKNNYQLPKLVKVTINVGLGKGKDDPKLFEVAESTLSRISGQKPVITLAKKSISNFKVREGMKVGLIVTLRGKNMWSFLTKLVHVAIPRVRDFRGINSKSIDQQGNLTIGFKEHIVFPEIKSDEVEKIHGLEVSITTTAGSREVGEALFRLLGFPIK